MPQKHNFYRIPHCNHKTVNEKRIIKTLIFFNSFFPLFLPVLSIFSVIFCHAFLLHPSFFLLSFFFSSFHLLCPPFIVSVLFLSSILLSLFSSHFFLQQIGRLVIIFNVVSLRKSSKRPISSRGHGCFTINPPQLPDFPHMALVNPG